VGSLYAELALYPKPGLVSFHDDGAHRDMNAGTFMRSLFALRHYFRDIADAGACGAPMGELRRLGMLAEARMLRATNGVNTHRGAIFSLGLLSAAAGSAWAECASWSDSGLRGVIATHWRRELVAMPVDDAAGLSHGLAAMARFGVAGARGEALAGFPSVFEIALPALRQAVARGMGAERAQLHALFMLLTQVDDTNVLHRGGAAALQRLRKRAAQFIAAGSVFADGWRARAVTLHHACSREGISAGGCADLLAAALFVHRLQTT
jgi:triphosphoribosyl-dephospho-CoA synthase